MKRIIITGLMLVAMTPAMAQETMDDGSMVVLPITAQQCEAICFDDEDTLLITSEQMEIFELKLDQLIDIK